MTRFSSSAGIAIGPILFIIAMLGIVAIAATAGVGGFSATSQADRVAADVGTQGNLIRAKIEECKMQALATGVDNSGAEPYDGVAACLHDMYPCSDQTSGTLVSALRCPGDTLGADSAQQNIWTGPRAASLPPPTAGFDQWMYYNGGSTADELGGKGGERCIWIAPQAGKVNPGVIAGMKRVASRLTSSETNYLETSVTQKLVIFITPPINNTLSGAASPCAP